MATDSEHPLPYQMDGAIAQVRGAVRIPGSQNWYAGLTYQYLQSTLTFKTSEVDPEQPDIPRNLHSAGLGPQLTYDSRDSNYYPQQGQYARLSWLNYGSRWGGDFQFDKLTITTFGGGVRWKVTAERDMNVGLDYAVSSDDRAVFIQIGERF